MADLFDHFERPVYNDRSGPKPWPGCDTSGEAWRRYCEAWQFIYRRPDPRLKGLIHDRRGRDAVRLIDRNIAVIQHEYAGGYANRADLEKEMMKPLPPSLNDGVRRGNRR